MDPFFPKPAGVWLRGSFHGHCREQSRCASVALEDSLRRYRAAGADFTAVTDHDAVTALEDMRRRFPDMMLFEGFEYSSRENLLFVGRPAEPLYRRPLEEALRGAGPGLLTMICHPQPETEGPDYWTLEKLLALGSLPAGIEVYNGHYGTASARQRGRQPLGTALWDAALTAGLRLWGYANDDSHDPEDFGNAWNMVYAEERTPAAVIAAARNGRCYGTTGLLLDTLTRHDNDIRIVLSSRARGRFIGAGGAVLGETEGRSFSHTPGRESYVRFEAEGPAGRIFLQPCRPGSRAATRRSSSAA